MPVVKPSLQSSQPIFTHQDFLDGKCTADGFPLDKSKRGGTMIEDEKKLPEEKTQTATEETPSEEEKKDEGVESGDSTDAT